MKKIALTLGLTGLIAAAGCTGSQDKNTLTTDSTDTAIFQQHAADVAGSNVGLLGTKMLALTFDDGPQRGSTETLLDYLKAEDIKATFFMVGRHIIGNADILIRMKNEGMSLGNHTFDHTPIVKMSRTNMNGVYNEIANDDKLISPFLASDKHIFFRSPGGSWTNLIGDAMNQHADLANKYIGPVFWDVGGTTVFADENGVRINGEAVKYDAVSGIVTLVKRGANGLVLKTWTARSSSLYSAADWDCSLPALNIPTAMCADGYMNEIRRHQGGIVLMHDTHPRTIEMVKLLIPRLKAEGYSFISMDDIPKIQKFE